MRMYGDVIMGGFGGQGIQVISQLVVEAAIRKGLEVTYLPSYGVEKRGGRTTVTVVLSDHEIGSPITNHPLCVIAMDVLALDKYQAMVAPGGSLIANTSLIPDEKIERGDISAITIRCNEEALSLGTAKVANMIALGAFLERSPILGFDDIERVMGDVFPERLHAKIPLNLKALTRGMEIAAAVPV